LAACGSDGGSIVQQYSVFHAAQQFGLSQWHWVNHWVPLAASCAAVERALGVFDLHGAQASKQARKLVPASDVQG
jgi:hypothetical protein